MYVIAAKTWLRLIALATGLLLGTGIGLLIVHDRFAPVLALPPFAVAVWLVARTLVAPREQGLVGVVLASSFALHVAITAALFTGSLALGRGGFITGDDAEYAFLARTFAAYARGQPDPASVPPYWGGSAYLFGTWVYIESAIFYLIGPDVVVPILLNGVFAMATSVLVYSMTAQLFGHRPATLSLALTAFYPSMTLWSSLNLKDPLALLLIAVSLWSVVRFHASPRWWWLALAFGVLVPMESLRKYLFVGLALLIPLVVALTPCLVATQRVRWTGAALIVAAVFLSLPQAGVSGAALGPSLLESFESTRYGMGVGARTRFVDLPPREVKVGDTFAVASLEPSASSDPSATPRIVHVPPNARIVVATRRPAGPTPTPASVVTSTPIVVHPGDVVVVGSADTTPAPVAARSVITAGPAPVQLRDSSTASESLAVRTLTHLPTGLAYALFAPFPWQLRRTLDALTVPEMLMWYVALAAATFTVLRHRRQWRTLFVLVSFSGGILLLLALVEGNVGTLYRHRSMAIPWVLVLAAPSLVEVLEYLRGAVRRSSKAATIPHVDG